MGIFRVTVAYRSEGEVYYVISNETEIIHKDDDLVRIYKIT
jgi:hypothetical protein